MLSNRLSFYAFDLLFLEGFDLRDSPQNERKRVLKLLFEETGLRSPINGINRSAHQACPYGNGSLSLIDAEQRSMARAIKWMPNAAARTFATYQIAI